MRNGILWVVILFSGGLRGAVPLTCDYIYPSGCRRGESCQVIAGGNWSGNPIALGVSGLGVKAQYSGAVYVSVPVSTAKSKTKSSKERPQYTRQALPGHSILSVSVDPAAETGLREVFVDYRYEVSNPLKFEISDYPEVVEPVTNRSAPYVAELIELPVCINGFSYGEVFDRYEFAAEKGRSLVALMKPDLIPPSGFVPALRVADSGGVVMTNGVVVHNEESAPILVFTVPETGRYTLLIGGDGRQRWRSAVYRVLFGELPLITGFSPSVAVKGRSVNVRVQGVNLADDRVRLFTGGKDAAMCMASIAGDAYVLPDLDFVLADEAIAADTEPNDTLDEAQRLTLPVVVEGELNADADKVDFFSFELPAGGAVYVDVSAPFSRSGGMPDVRVRDAAGKLVGAEKTLPDALRAALPAAPLSFRCESETGGRYTVEIAVGKGVTAHTCVYRLRVGPPAPDFTVWMNPVSINIPLNGSCPVNLSVHRIHGFAAPISVAAAFPPLGVLSSGGVIPGDQVEGVVTVWTDGYRYPRTPFYQELMAQSTAGGALVQKPVVPILLPSAAMPPSSRAVLFEKPPARIAYYRTGMCVDMEGGRALTLWESKETEIKLLFKNAKGSVAADYTYSIESPQDGVEIREVRESTSAQVVRLLLQVKKGGGLASGAQGHLIIGMANKGANELLTVSQAVPFNVR